MHAVPHTLAFIEGLGGPEVMVIFFIVLILFGGKKLPEFARGLGRAVNEFKKASAEVETQLKKTIEAPMAELNAEKEKLTAPVPPTPPASAAPAAPAPSSSSATPAAKPADDTPEPPAPASEKS